MDFVALAIMRIPKTDAAIHSDSSRVSPFFKYLFTEDHIRDKRGSTSCTDGKRIAI